jgi:hypothetical protein
VSLVLGSLYLVLFTRINRRRRELGVLRPNRVQVMAAVGVVLSVVGVVWAVGRPLVLNVLIGLVIIASDVILIILLRRQPKPSLSGEVASASPEAIVSRTISASLGLGFAFIIPIIANSGVIVSMAVIAVTVIPVTSYQGQPVTPGYSLIDLVQNAYLAQARIGLLVFVGAVASVGLITLIVSGLSAISRWIATSD